MTAAADTQLDSLRILLADEQQDRLDRVAEIVRDAGHEVIARTIHIGVAAEAAAETDPDVAIVAPGESDEHALELIARLVEDAACPVVVFLEKDDPALLRDAARLGVFGHVTDGDADELQASLEIALRRYAELRDLAEAFYRRATVERAKGVLMERHDVGEQEAFDLMRRQARSRHERVVDIARAVLGGHALLPRG